jgi:uncharacterized protein YuzE
MRIRYDPSVDAMYIDLTDADVMTSDEVAQGIIFDYDVTGAVIGIEVLDASECVGDLTAVRVDGLPAFPLSGHDS